MTQLSDTQSLILSAAAQRPEHIALPLSDSLRSGADVRDCSRPWRSSMVRVAIKERTACEASSPWVLRRGSC